MKNIISIIALAFVSFSLTAQQNALDKYFTNYQSDEDFTKVTVSGKMFELIGFMETDDEDIKEVQEFTSGVESLRMLFGHEITKGFNKYDQAINKVKNDYEELMSIDDKEGKVTFYIDEKDGIVSEFVVVGAADNALCLISMVGQIDLKKLGDISKKIQADGFDYIGKMSENGANKVKVYPNPLVSGGTVNVEIPQELEGADIQILNISGQEVRNLRAKGTTESISLNGLKSGNYIINITKDGVSIKKKITIQ